jgi:hypothetical protein
MKYDRSLRELLGEVPKEFIKILTDKNPKKFLDISFPTTKEFRVDLLVLLEDNSIFHLEVQTKNDNNMDIRMLQYYSFIKEKYKTNSISQMVLFLGDNNMFMNNEINDNFINYSFVLKDIKEIDCENLIQSDDINDNVLAILCKIEKFELFWNKLSIKLLSLPEKRREDYLKKISLLLGLRPTIKKRLKELDMPIVLEVREDDPFYQDGIQKGIQKGVDGMYKLGIEKDKIMAVFNLSNNEFDEIIKNIKNEHDNTTTPTF